MCISYIPPWKKCQNNQTASQLRPTVSTNLKRKKTRHQQRNIKNTSLTMTVLASAWIQESLIQSVVLSRPWGIHLLTSQTTGKDMLFKI